LHYYIPEITITTAQNGELAIQAYEQGDYDLVLMDVQMPGGMACRQRQPSGKKNLTLEGLQNADHRHDRQPDEKRSSAVFFSRHG
jgi:CheY-like chemotaxis protein